MLMTLYHAIGKGIEPEKIFHNIQDRQDLLSRLADPCREENLICNQQRENQPGSTDKNREGQR